MSLSWTQQGYPLQSKVLVGGVGRSTSILGPRSGGAQRVMVRQQGHGRGWFGLALHATGGVFCNPEQDGRGAEGADLGDPSCRPLMVLCPMAESNNVSTPEAGVGGSCGQSQPEICSKVKISLTV